MRIHILTLFPSMFQSPFSESIISRAVDKGLVDIQIHDIRSYTHDRHRTADDSPYGGGPGMVMKPDPIFEALEAIKTSISLKQPNSDDAPLPIILLSPQGRTFNQSIAEELAREDEMLLICGHYEGIDERVRERLATDEISIGDYVLTGGETAAMVLVDAVVRLIPGVLGSDESTTDDTFSSGLLQHPQYTRPPSFKRWDVPEVLLSGNYARIAKWRRQQALLRTLEHRPDLLKKAQLTEEDWDFLKSLKKGS